jgi:hypothetical protein
MFDVICNFHTSAFTPHILNLFSHFKWVERNDKDEGTIDPRSQLSLRKHRHMTKQNNITWTVFHN